MILSPQIVFLCDCRWRYSGAAQNSANQKAPVAAVLALCCLFFTHRLVVGGEPVCRLLVSSYCCWLRECMWAGLTKLLWKVRQEARRRRRRAA